MVVVIPISIPTSVSSARAGPNSSPAPQTVKWQELSDDSRQLAKHELDTLAYTYSFPLENILDCDETRTAFEDYLHRIKNQENYIFLNTVEEFWRTRAHKNRFKQAEQIIENFVRPKALYELNVGDQQRKSILNRWDNRLLQESGQQEVAASPGSPSAMLVPGLVASGVVLSPQCCPRDLFDPLAQVVFGQLVMDVLPRFIQSREFTKALGNLILARGLRDAVIDVLDGKLRNPNNAAAAAAAVASALASQSTEQGDTTSNAEDTKDDTSSETADKESGIAVDEATEKDDPDALSESSGIIVPSSSSASSAATTPQSPVKPSSSSSSKRLEKQLAASQKVKAHRLVEKYVKTHEACIDTAITWKLYRKSFALMSTKYEPVFWNTVFKDTTKVLRLSRKSNFSVGSSKKIMAYYTQQFLQFQPDAVWMLIYSQQGRLAADTNLTAMKVIRYISTIDKVKADLKAISMRTNATIKEYDEIAQFASVVYLSQFRLPWPLKSRYGLNSQAAFHDPLFPKRIMFLLSTCRDPEADEHLPRGSVPLDMFGVQSVEPHGTGGCILSEYAALNFNSMIPSSYLNGTIKERVEESYKTYVRELRKRVERGTASRPADDEFQRNMIRSMQENDEILKLVHEAKCQAFGKTAVAEALAQRTIQVDSEDDAV